LGQDRVINLNCTFETARSIPYYRLPLRSLSLAALAEHFFGVKLDKTYQKADWGARPLSQEQLAYAASDTEWCRRIYDELQKIPRPPAVSDDDPAAIARCYIELLAPLKDARLFREDIRAAVKEFMIAKNVHRLSRFEVHTSTAHSTDLRTLAQFALTTDPGGYFGLRINLSHKILSVLGPEARAQMQHGAEIGVTQTFRGPRGPRSRDRPAATYALNPLDAGELTSDYETADHNVSVLTSERDELRQRMKLWMQAQGLHAWGDFSFSAPRERWKVDVRAIADGTIREPIQIAFPQRLRLAFGESELEQLIAAGVTKEVPVLRWLPRALSVGPEAQQSRDWSDGTDTTQAGEE
jgi:ribonuclease D